MKSPQNNYAFIDSQNLHLSIKSLGWFLDFRRFRVYLREKYGVERAFFFIGFDQTRSSLYTAMQEMGYICVFKPTIRGSDGIVKGNCDAELVLNAMIEYPNYDRAVIVSGDGDFYCLIDYLREQGKLEAVLVPNKGRYSALLKTQLLYPFLRFVSDLEKKMARKKEKTP